MMIDTYSIQVYHGCFYCIFFENQLTFGSIKIVYSYIILKRCSRHQREIC